MEKVKLMARANKKVKLTLISPTNGQLYSLNEFLSGLEGKRFDDVTVTYAISPSKVLENEKDFIKSINYLARLKHPITIVVTSAAYSNQNGQILSSGDVKTEVLESTYDTAITELAKVIPHFQANHSWQLDQLDGIKPETAKAFGAAMQREFKLSINEGSFRELGVIEGLLAGIDGSGRSAEFFKFKAGPFLKDSEDARQKLLKIISRSGGTYVGIHEAADVDSSYSQESLVKLLKDPVAYMAQMEAKVERNQEVKAARKYSTQAAAKKAAPSGH